MRVKCFGLLLLLSSSIAHAADPPEEGKLLFNTRCAGCHNVNKVLTGPALGGVTTRHPVAWIVKFVRSSRTLVQAGDKDAVAIFEKFNRVPMPDHPDITEEQITAILDYVKVETKEISEKKPFSKPGKKRPAYQPVPLSNYAAYLAYLSVVLLLSWVMVFFVKVKTIERQSIRRKNEDHL